MLSPSFVEIDFTPAISRVSDLVMFFLTLALTTIVAANLTTWGYLDCQRDMGNGAFGGQSKQATFTFQL